MAKVLSVQKDIRKLSSVKAAEQLQYFFKTGKGQYGEGDRFLGIKVPPLREIAKKYSDLGKADLKTLMQSEWHEERYVAGQILVMQYKKAATLSAKKQAVKFYLSLRKGLNNWDLVDSTAYFAVGDLAAKTGNIRDLLTLSESKRHWDRRTAVVATLALIRIGDNKLIYRFAKKYLNEKEDLMHKAVGWMLREAAKRDPNELREFIKKNGPRMPRTMLRYAIERFSADERKKILTVSRSD